MKRYRLIVETDAEAFADVEDLLATVEVALDAERRSGEIAAVWLDEDMDTRTGSAGPSSPRSTNLGLWRGVTNVAEGLAQLEGD